MASFRDQAWHPVTASSAVTVDALDQFAAEVLSHGTGASAILGAAADDPACPLAQIYAASLYLFLQTADGPPQASPWLDRARVAARQGTERERLWLSAVEAWHRGRADVALDHHATIARRWPRDLLNVKVAQIHQLNLGDRRGMRDLAEAVVPHNGDAPFLWGLVAFGLEQTDNHDRAEAAGRRAVEVHRDDPWAHHAVGHVLHGQGRLEEALAWMEDHSGTWGRCSSFMYTHNWWHTAILHIDLDVPDRALALFDERVWGVRKSYVQDQVNAVALLARLELRGLGAGEARWADVADHVRPRSHDHVNGFFDLHYAYALARAGDLAAVEDMLDSVAVHAGRAPAFSRPVWQEVAPAAIRGMAAHARGRYAESAAHLGPVRDRLGLLGGSTAQQDWFEQVYLDSLERSGLHQEAQALYAQRIARRATVPWQYRGMAELYRSLQMGPAAEAAMAQARALTARYLGTPPSDPVTAGAH